MISFWFWFFPPADNKWREKVAISLQKEPPMNMFSLERAGNALVSSLAVLFSPRS